MAIPRALGRDDRTTSRFEAEVSRGQRFQFGRNWLRFLSVLDEDRIAEAEKSLCGFLELKQLTGKSFLDAGSGSGLFSLAARRLGARVHSFDYDPDSVACTEELKRRYFPEDPDWRIEHGSLLDASYLTSLGGFDVVYSWGVLHHTGAMSQAMENVAVPVLSGGCLFISIYNDQGRWSTGWRSVKRIYCSSLLGRVLISAIFIPYFVLGGFAMDLSRGKRPWRHYFDYRKSRGMSLVHDWFDWLGGYPFEVAKPEEVFDFYRNRGFVLQRLITCGGQLGCNQFVFRKG